MPRAVETARADGLSKPGGVDPSLDSEPQRTWNRPFPRQRRQRTTGTPENSGNILLGDALFHDGDRGSKRTAHLRLVGNQPGHPNRSRMRHCKSTALLGAVLLTSCHWYTHYECRSPDGLGEVRIVKSIDGDASYRFRIELIYKQRRDILWRNDGDSAIALVETYWAPDARAVSLLVCNSIGKDALVAYDVERREPLPSRTYVTEIAQQIQRRYQVPRSLDTLSWACSPEGANAYWTNTIHR